MRVMMSVFATGLLIATMACGESESKPGAMATAGAQIAWPPLPTTGFVCGRAATGADIDAGNAVFAVEVGGQIVGVAIDIEIPQYAIHVDEAAQVRTRVIVIQAERAEGLEIVGYRTLAGEFGAATLAEFELLGREKPAE